MAIILATMLFINGNIQIHFKISATPFRNYEGPSNGQRTASSTSATQMGHIYFGTLCMMSHVHFFLKTKIEIAAYKEENY